MSRNENDSNYESDGEGNPEYNPSDEFDNDEAEPNFGPGGNTGSAFDTILNGVGEWEEMHGNYVLKPPKSYEGQPR